ncbi:helix-turn-helix transcriptional regulator [Piscinibacter gummiphilus]|uniref:Autoinducer binding domain-containing protein n=1 Tax=Piscinibacter gummiphilus TaxID=946333 RepID=A0ABZ0CW75_9BURK|nr:autoinducer binding domain-containing protein [Piscinibacter gummiphilus]WOB09220.1 autoinducer binding domain-containing protein [Piscinibacter gummiphilus]
MPDHRWETVLKPSIATATGPALPAPMSLPTQIACPAAETGGAQVLLHEEPVFRAPRRVKVPTQPSLLQALIGAESADERRRIVTTLLHVLGFEWLGYGRFASRSEPGTPVSFCTTYVDSHWAERYFGARHYEVDPRLPRALQSCLPVVWTLDHLLAVAQPDDGRLQRFVDELAGTGMRSGVILALPGATHTDRQIVSLLSRTPGSGWMGDGLLGQVLTLALCLHEFYTRYATPPEPAGGTIASPRAASAGLTPLQREILACVSQGLGDKAIAARLGIGLHNVDYHMRQLRKRFGVRNRVQLLQAMQGDDAL